jgi:hypothetical protein
MGTLTDGQGVRCSDTLPNPLGLEAAEVCGVRGVRVKFAKTRLIAASDVGLDRLALASKGPVEPPKRD